MAVKIEIILYFSWFVALTTPVKGYRSCGEIKDAKGNISAPYSIEIGGKTVSVSCNLTSNPAVTIIPVHDVVQVPNPGNYRKPQSYIYNVNYGKLPVSDLREFIEQSESCKQYVSYKCRNASLFGNMKNSLSSWTSVSDNPKNYWAECGFDDPNPKCHCDQEHSKPVEDAGYLLKKKDLPVKGLQIGGLSSSSNVSIIIGNIMCYGDSQKDAFTFENKNAFVSVNVSSMTELKFKFKLAKVGKSIIASIRIPDQKELEIRVTDESNLQVGNGKFDKLDEEWHSIVLSVSDQKDKMYGVVNNGEKKSIFEQSNIDTAGAMLVLGDSKQKCETFVGCVKELTVDGKDYTSKIRESKMKKFLKEGCKDVQSGADCTIPRDPNSSLNPSPGVKPSGKNGNNTGDGDVDDDGSNNDDAAIIAIVVVFLILLIILLVVFFITWYLKRNKGVYQTHEGSAENIHGDTENLTLVTKPSDQEADGDKGKEYYL